MAQAAARSLRILHVDDDAVNLLVMDHMLASLGHEPTGVASAGEALEALAGARFDAVLTDIHMPDVDGVVLVEEMQARGLGDVAVVAVTADVMGRPGPAYEGLGFSAAIAKPIMAESIEAALANAMRKPARRRFLSMGMAKG